jgi:hypothetical protein
VRFADSRAGAKLVRHREHVAKELLETEKTYVKGLETAIQVPPSLLSSLSLLVS